jgi:vacuolar-type H+-ATPase subunit H
LAAAHPVAEHDIPKARLRWDRILDEANSENDQNRRLAILEADIMLNELLDDLGYKGETLADKMRQVPKAQFNTIDLAWEAHRARNKIAHEAGHEISAYEAKRIIGLYDKVFREFGFIEEH